MMSAFKKCMIVVIILATLGATIFVIALAPVNFNLMKTTKYVEESFEITDGFEDIKVTATTTDIKILPAEDGLNKITVKRRENQIFTHRCTDGTLEISMKDNPRKWYESILNFGKSTLTLYLCENEYGKLLVDSTTSDLEVTLPKSMNFSAVDIELTTGDVKLTADSKSHINIDLSTGDVKLSSLAAKSLSIEATTGDLKITDVDVTESVNLKNTTGDIAILNMSAASYTSKSTTGDSKLENLLVSGLMEIKAGTGDIKFVSCDAGEINVKTTTGDVKGTLLTPKMFSYDTTTGSVKLPASQPGGSCKLETTTGDIKISIVAP